MADGSRLFASFPQRLDPIAPQWDALRAHVAGLAGATPTQFVTDGVTEAWIHFDCDGHAFALHNPVGEWWLFVDDPTCPDAILARVADHVEALLDPIAGIARGHGPLPPGWFRVVVGEPDGRFTHHDFASLTLARGHAADAQHECDDPRGSPIAWIFDAAFDHA